MNDQIELNVSGIFDERSLHHYLFKMLNFPEYYGSNWDAFDECIRDVEVPKKLIISHFAELQSKVPRGARLLKECLDDFSKEKEGDIEILFC